MKVIGIVGGMGAGKSTVIELINSIQPVSYISADKIGHDILLKGHEAYDQIVAYFGQGILDEKCEIIRKKLGEIAFSDKQQLSKLNEITHPVIKEIVKKQIENFKRIAPEKQIILEAAVLFESGLVDLTDVVIAVYADKKTRMNRIIQREGLEEKQILKRFEAQKEWEELQGEVDYVIDNSMSLEETQYQLEALLKRL